MKIKHVCGLLFQDILDEMRKELSKLKEELIDGNNFALSHIVCARVRVLFMESRVLHLNYQAMRPVCSLWHLFP